MKGDFRSAVRVTRPTRATIFMLAFLGAVAVVAYFLAQPIYRVFLANPWLNGLILFALAVGIAYAFWQVSRLSRCVDWIDAFIAERPGFDTITPPPLLASMAGMLRERESRRALSATTVRAILDSIATRLDESREIVRYARDLLIFLGLLGTFWGLSIAVPAIVATIRELGPVADASGADVFGRLVTNLGDQMKGLETAFASSLLGLAGSLILGFLDLLAGHAQNRFYRELEEALAQITHISRADAEGGGSGYAGAALERATEAMEALIDRMDEAQARTITGADAMAGAAQELSAIAEGYRTGETALRRIGEGQDALRVALEEATERNRGVLGGMDEATRQRIENMEAYLLRLVEEVAAGRAESTAALRGELQTLTRVIAAAARGELPDDYADGAR